MVTTTTNLGAMLASFGAGFLVRLIFIDKYRFVMENGT
jgi:hypothetical protein